MAPLLKQVALLPDASRGREHHHSTPLRPANTLAVRVAERIRTRLGERISNLEVTCTSSSVTLRGVCATYYSKQLAQHAALGVLEDEQLENQIEVAP